MDDFKVPTLPSAAPKTELTTQDGTESQSAQPQAVPEKAISTSNCPYKIPAWSGLPPPSAPYRFEVLKSGQIIDEVKDLQKQAQWKFGRFPENEIEMAHPTISRFHAVLQYRPSLPKEKLANEKEEHVTESKEDVKDQPPEGWYIYDLDSTHGTFLNKQRIPARVYIRIRVGHMLRLGASTRNYILQGPTEDEEPESELTVTELRELRKQQEADAAVEAQRKAAEAEERERTEGIGWGMGEDADEETDLTHNPFASSTNEELFLDDPKRTLRGYFEREGLTLEYKCDEMSTGSFVCRVELPLDDSNGRPIIAEVSHKGKKKECVVQCALEACRILDRHGVLRQANQEPLKRKVTSKDSDSDDDEFWDRTGDVERKKQRKANSSMSTTLTYDDLMKQEEELLEQLQKVEANIAKYQETEKRLKATRALQEENGDDFDSFMENLTDDATKLDKTEIRKLRIEQQRIKTDQLKLQRLIKIAQPVYIPSVHGVDDVTGREEDAIKPEVAKKQLPMIGKRNQFSKFKMIKTAPTVVPTKKMTIQELGSDEEEIEEEPETAPDPLIEKNHLHSSKEESQNNNEDVKKPEKIGDEGTTATKLYGPAIIPPREILEGDTTVIDTAVPEDHAGLISPTDGDIEPSNGTNADSMSKKRRNRQRLRNKRHEVDQEDLDEHETSEKYAKWMPPENQSGDGYTKLNEKYGY